MHIFFLPKGQKTIHILKQVVRIEKINLFKEDTVAINLKKSRRKSRFVWEPLRGIASLRINLSLKTVQLSPPIFGHFCEYIILLFCP